MISRSSIPKQISKGGSMPQGKGTYGSTVGRPPKKKLYKVGGSVAGRPGARSKKKKDVNVPGEKKRGYKGYVDHMVSMAEGRFKKMMKDIKAKRRTPHKG